MTKRNEPVIQSYKRLVDHMKQTKDVTGLALAMELQNAWITLSEQWVDSLKGKSR